jgi:hypothetical protein
MLSEKIKNRKKKTYFQIVGSACPRSLTYILTPQEKIPLLETVFDGIDTAKIVMHPK